MPGWPDVTIAVRKRVSIALALSIMVKTSVAREEDVMKHIDQRGSGSLNNRALSGC